MSVRVTIELPERVFRIYSAQAERTGTHTHKLLANQLTRHVHGSRQGGLVGLSEAQVARLLQMYADGASDGAIARELGVSQSSVTRRRRRLGLPALYSFPGASQ